MSLIASLLSLGFAVPVLWESGLVGAVGSRLLSGKFPAWEYPTLLRGDRGWTRQKLEGIRQDS